MTSTKFQPSFMLNYVVFDAKETITFWFYAFNFNFSKKARFKLEMNNIIANFFNLI